jgi:predicted secreted protein
MNRKVRWRAALVGVISVVMIGSMNVAHAAKSDDTLIVRDLPAKVRLVPGEKVRITLPTNLTTGYTWLADGGCCTRDNKQIARISKGRYSAPANPQGMVGVPGSTTWTITALRPGTTTVTIITRPPGVQNTMQDEEVGTLRVTVMPR